MEANEKRYMNIREVSAYIGVSRWWVYKLVSARRIPFIPLSRKVLKFDRERIDRWMKKKEVGTIQDFDVKEN